MITPKQFAAGSMVVGFLAFDFIATATPLFEVEWGVLALSGVFIGQVNLIATWGALGPGNVVVRLPWSILLGLLTWYALALGLQIHSDYTGARDLGLLGLVLVGGILVAQIPLWIAARFFRWRLIDVNETQGTGTDGPFQFSVRHILMVMVLLAVALGLARLALPPKVFDGVSMDGTLVVILIAVVITNLVMTIPCIWGALVRVNPVRPVLWPAYCGVVTGIEFGALCIALGPPGNEWTEPLLAFFLLNLSQCATVYFTLRLFRSVGCRLVRPLSGSAMDEALNPPEFS